MIHSTLKYKISATVLVILAFAIPVFASHFWEVRMSTPEGLTNQSTFNIEFAALSIDPADIIKVELFQDGVNLPSAEFEKTTSAEFGDSGAFALDLTDGTYKFKIAATSAVDAETRMTPEVLITVDTAFPAAPSYSGKSRNGNTYTLTFTPLASDTKEVRIYSSASKTFTANSSTIVGTVSATPGTEQTFLYTASDSNERYHAIIAVDKAGNFSAVVGDPDIQVQTDDSTTNNGIGPTTTVSTTNTTGVQSDENGEVLGETETDTNADENGDVAGAIDENGGSLAWIILTLLAVGLVVFITQRRRSTPSK